MERFSQKPLSQYSHWRASAYVGGPNLLTSEDIYQKAIEPGDNTPILLITGDRAFPEAYAAEIRFLSIAYIGCPTYFEEEFYWRMATEEEAAEIQAYSWFPGAQVYCLEERPPEWIKKPPLKYFLAAANVEITLFYSDELEELHSWGEEP